jgi:hypothetical protein
MYYSYIEIEYVATSFSPARTNLALKLLTRKKISAMICVDMQDVRIVLLSKKVHDFVRVGERGIEFMVLAYLLLVYRISSINPNKLYTHLS